MTKNILILAALGLAIGAQGATLRNGAACATSRDNDIVAEHLLREGDQAAFQLMVTFHKAVVLTDGTQIDILSSVEDSKYLAIRVMETFDVYYTFYTNVIDAAPVDVIEGPMTPEEIRRLVNGE